MIVVGFVEVGARRLFWYVFSSYFVSSSHTRHTQTIQVRLPPIPVSSSTTLRIHFSCDDWRPHEIGTIEEASQGGFVEIHRCLPPGRQYFVFTTLENLHIISPQLPLKNISIKRFEGIDTMLRGEKGRITCHYIDVRSYHS